LYSYKLISSFKNKKHPIQNISWIKHKEKKCIAVQFHPEASPGPYDCKFIFEELKNLMEEGNPGKK